MLTRIFAIVFVIGAVGLCRPVFDRSEVETTVIVAKAEAVDFDSDRWVIGDKRARREERLGRRSIYLTSGFAWLKDAQLSDGTIEVDVAASEQRAFLGVVFRFTSPDEHEIIYLRPHKTGLDDAVQYSPSFAGSAPWQIYSGPGYTAAAEIPKEKWMRLKLEIRGLQCRVSIDEKTVLEVKDLKRDEGGGMLGLWGGARGGHFSNFRYTPAPGAQASMKRPVASYQPGIVTNWEMSKAFTYAERKLESYPEAVKSMEWQRVGVEPPGLVVIDRYRRNPGILPPFAADPAARLKPTPEKGLVYLRTTIESDREQVKRLSFGYSDEAAIFLNGRIVFAGRSAFRFRDPGFLGIVDVENDAVHLPLRRGSNELIIAVGEYFGGWGVIARLD